MPKSLGDGKPKTTIGPCLNDSNDVRAVRASIRVDVNTCTKKNKASTKTDVMRSKVSTLRACADRCEAITVRFAALPDIDIS